MAARFARRPRGLTHAGVVLLYVGFAALVLRPLFGDSGHILGGDWSMPLTTAQMREFGNMGSFVWTDHGHLFGVRQPFMIDAPFRAVVSLLGAAGLDGIVVTRGLTVWLFCAAALSIYAYCRYLGAGALAAAIGGLAFITTPVFFNYLVMGWIFILWAIALLPLSVMSFREALVRGRLEFAVVAGLIAALAGDPRALVWYPIAWLLVGLATWMEGGRLRRTIATFLAALGVLVVSEAFWAPLLLGGDSIVAEPASFSNVPLGFWLNAVDFLRLRGSLFNHFYELSLPSGLEFAGFMLPVLALGIYLAYRRDWRGRVHAWLAILPYFIWLFWELLASIPYGQFLRDPSRWIILQSFAYAAMIALLVDLLLKKRKQVSKYLFVGGAIAVAGTLGIQSLPFWNGSLVVGSPQDQVLGIRTWKPSAAHAEVEAWLSETSRGSKALFLPTGSHPGLIDDPRFNGPHREFSDVFASYGPVPGTTSAVRWASGLSNDFRVAIEDSLSAEAESSTSRLLGLANIRHVVVRTDMYGPGLDMDEVVSQLRSNSRFRQVFESGPVVAFENLEPLPRVYAASRSIVSYDGAVGISRDVEGREYVHGATVFLADDRQGQTNGAPNLPGDRTSLSERPVIRFSQKNPTRFDIRASAEAPFWLVLSESFDRGWKAYVSPIASSPNGNFGESDPRTGSASIAPGDTFTPADVKYLARDSLAEDRHMVANGYANVWYIDPGAAGGSEFEITLFFRPQGYYYVGLAFSILAILSLLSFVGVRILRPRHPPPP